MNATNLNIVLTNALCCSSQLATKVSKLYSTGSLCVNTEFDKLKLLIDKIEVLKCYNFPIETNTLNTNSKFYTLLNATQIDRLDRIFELNIQLYINGTLYNIISDDVHTALELIINKLTELGIFVSYLITQSRITEFELTLTCDILDVNFNIEFSDNPLIEYQFTNIVPGICPSTIIVPAQNCLTEEQADIMMQDIMRQCDICNCQLTT